MSTRDHPDWWRPMGGQNSQDSTLERRSLVWNDDEDILPADRVRTETTDEWKGKFFTRGCRGMIEQIQIYSAGNAANTLTLNISPHPCLGPLYTVDVTPGVAEGWYGADFEMMWNYDSLFIWVTDVEALVSWWYDEFLPYDGHECTDGQDTWEDLAIRPFIRAVYTGETPGDVPVSGTINVIDIPSVASRIATVAAVNVPHAVITEVIDIVGAGTLLEASLTFETSVAPVAGDAPAAIVYGIYFIADGVLAYYTNNRMLTQSYIATSGRCAIGEFYQGTVADPAWDETEMTVRLPIKFRRRLQIRAYQSTGAAVDVYATGVTNLIR